jgi:uncharacterized cupredoxin-like copper-binding protein
MQKMGTIVLLIAFLSLGFGKEAIAQQTVHEIPVRLGDASGQLRFFPDQLRLQAHQKYKLLLSNPSPSKHYFTAKDFADASWTQKVQAGKVEVKGAIHDLELQPGGEAEWVLIPEKAGTYTLYCSVPGHREAGMVGAIAVQATN